MKISLMLILFLSLAACSNRGMYEGIQASNRFECAKVPHSQYDECMEDANKPYIEYDRERKELLEK